MLLEQFMKDTASKMFSRADWIAACKFQPLDTQQVLEKVLKGVKDRGGGFSDKPPQVVLDLDSTLYETSHRTLSIALSWLEKHAKNAHESTRTAFETCTPEDFGYSLRDTFEYLALDLQDKAVLRDLEDLRKYWFEHFFTERFLSVDKPYEGTVHFAQELHAAGAHLVYLTGRVESKMGKGTFSNLRRDGFPIHQERTDAFLKASDDISDRDHKRTSFEVIAKRGPIVASFENEPQNIAAMHAIDPSVMHVFVDTVYSDHPTPAIPGLYRVSHFRR